MNELSNANAGEYIKVKIRKRQSGWNFETGASELMLHIIAH